MEPINLEDNVELTGADLAALGAEKVAALQNLVKQAKSATESANIGADLQAAVAEMQKNMAEMKELRITALEEEKLDELLKTDYKSIFDKLDPEAKKEMFTS